jgi:uncharacterized membrane protein
MKKFLTTTALGGILFLVPLVFVVLIVGKAYELMMRVAEPISRLVPVDTIAGVGIINLLAIAAMLLSCLLAGLIARSRPARRLYDRFDRVLLELIPGYAWTKALVSSLGDAGEATEKFKPVLVRLDDQMQLGFEMERTNTDLVVVFFPGAPDVRSGSVAYVEASRVRAAEGNLLAINKSLKLMGIGAVKLLPADS